MTALNFLWSSCKFTCTDILSLFFPPVKKGQGALPPVSVQSLPCSFALNFTCSVLLKDFALLSVPLNVFNFFLFVSSLPSSLNLFHPLPAEISLVRAYYFSPMTQHFLSHFYSTPGRSRLCLPYLGLYFLTLRVYAAHWDPVSNPL